MGMNTIPHQEDSSTGKLVRQKSIAGTGLVTEYPIKSYTIVSGAYLYEGFAVWGSATSAAVWAMFRTPTAGGATQRADSGASTQIADNYASLTYAD